MDTSDRINLIEALLDFFTSAGGPEFDRVDMALDEFGFPIGPVPDLVSREEYFRERIRQGNDRNLVEVSDHFRLQAQTSELDKAVWKKDRFRIFLSFISGDGVYANDVKNALERLGVEAFLSHMDIEPNTLWQDTIKRALNSCDALVALLTPAYHESKWTDQEIGWAYGRNVPVIAVRQGLDPYGFIAESQGVRGGTPEEVAAQAVGALRRDNRSGHKVARSVVHALEASPSYSATRTIYPHVESIEQWDDDMLDAVERALTRNDWVSDAHYKGWGNPLRPRIEALLARHRQHAPTDEFDDLPFK